jgi:hypothetical protein
MKDGKIRAMFPSKNVIELIKSMDQGTIQAFKAYFHSKLPGDVNSELQITEFLRIFTLKSVANSDGLAPGKVMSSATENCLKDTVTYDKCNSISKTRCEGCV